MAEKTGISWTDSTFNPWIGCQRVSPGCELCYAEAQDARYKWGGATHWGPTAPRMRTSAANWRKPVQWNAAAAKLKKRHLVFCASLADVFEDREDLVPMRRDLFELIDHTPALTWLLLTKRPENIPAMMGWGWGRGLHGFPPHVWLGTTVEDQKRKGRIDILRQVVQELPITYDGSFRKPLAWLSVEPQIEDLGRVDLAGIGWVIVGGESAQRGEKARPFDLAWARSLRAQCASQNVAYFFKQKGSNVVDNGKPIDCVGKGDDPSVWPEGIRGREFPQVRLA